MRDRQELQKVGGIQDVVAACTCGVDGHPMSSVYGLKEESNSYIAAKEM